MRRTTFVGAIMLASFAVAHAQSTQLVVLGNSKYGRYTAGLSHAFGYRGSDSLGKVVFVGCDGKVRPLTPPATFEEAISPCPRGDGAGAMPVVFANSYIIGGGTTQTYIRVFDVAGGADAALVHKSFRISSQDDLAKNLGTNDLKIQKEFDLPGGSMKKFDLNGTPLHLDIPTQGLGKKGLEGDREGSP